MMKQRVTTQEEILEHALKIAIEEGVDKVSIRKLATSCGIAVGSMYNYYKDKDALMTAVSEHFWGNILKDQEQLFRPGMGFTMFLEEDDRVIGSIWNMELNQNAFCEYVLNNIVALIRTGESNCRFFILLLEHLLYDA